MRRRPTRAPRRRHFRATAGRRRAAGRSSAAAIVPLGLLLAVTGQRGDAQAQISPGPLARAHAELEGPLKCMKCHARDDEGLDRQCLACHREIDATLKTRRGLHGKAGLSGCAKCHPDHAGEDFELVAWEEGSEERFDHSRTTFELRGRHREVKCRECHNAGNSVSDVAALSPRKDRSRGFVGLKTDCRSCHEDPHERVLGDDCRSCHDENAWKPAALFRHDDAAWPLTGKHRTVECASCHLAERLELPLDARGERRPLWKPLAHGECSDCHEDVHQGRLGPECATCHDTNSFEKADRSDFDHDRTRYPLRGRHRTVECGSCHDEKTAWGARPRFERCTDCHEEAHGDPVVVRGARADCNSCHTVERFAPATVTAARHADFAYPLEGAHRHVACASCHPKKKGPAAAGLGTAAVLLRPEYAACTDCHADPHESRFATGGERPYSKGCLACHGMDAFRPARFGIEEHERSLFPLEGAHRTVPCSDCHEALRRTPVRTDFRERFGRCIDCHQTPHGRQFDERGDCSTCHGLEAFTPADRFDHETMAAFPLKGAHAAVACSECHARRGEEVVYRPLAHECQDCHGPNGPCRQPPNVPAAHGANGPAMKEKPRAN